MDHTMQDVNSIYKAVFELLEGSHEECISEPYKYKYEARDKLECMKIIISNEMDSRTDSPLQSDLLKIKYAAIILNLGIIGLDTEEYSTGQENLEKVIELTSGKELNSDCISLTVLCYNKLAILWSHRDELKKSQDYLDNARNFYACYRAQNEVPTPKSVHELFLQDNISIPCGWEDLEKLHTLTLYYLAQVKEKLGELEESSQLCLSTLHRQLAFNDYSSFTWALNAALLAKFFQSQKTFKLARRLLAAAWTMFERDALVDHSSIRREEREEKSAETKAQLSRCWGFYCVDLLQHSSDVIDSDENHEERDVLSHLKQYEKECLEKMEFPQLELCNHEESVRWHNAVVFEDAKELFQMGFKCFTESQSYYTLENYCSIHTEIAQSISKLYELLAQFEISADRKSKMQKRRIDILSSILRELNPQYYLQVCRELNCEIGGAYSIMVDCKYSILGNAKPTAQQVNKINHLVKSSIEHFENFLSTFISPSGEKPNKFPESIERSALVAYFVIGRLWSKMMSTTMEGKIEHTAKSLESYKALVDYCDVHPDSAVLMEKELPVSKEIVELLPLKIQRMRELSMNSES